MLQKVTSLLVVLALFIIVPFTAFAQQTGVQGTIYDADDGEELPGATVRIDALEVGTTSDAEGNYELTGLEPGSYSVIFSFVGYREQERSVDITDGEMTTLNVELVPDALGLDELVVTGYGIRERREVTGAISSVRGERVRGRTIQTPDQALQGQSAGTQFVGSSGQPGAAANIRIRGIGSIHSGNSPLFIVDGVPIEDYFRSNIATTNSNVLGGINPSDIESIEVLRDAEATAIYGAQGANGVVLITTRRGQEGVTNFTASVRGGVHQLHREYDYMEGPDFVNFMMEAYENRARDLGQDIESARQSAFETYRSPGAESVDDVQTYDWFGEMTRPGYNQRYSLSAQGGTETTRFFVSGGYEDHQGTFYSSYYDRMTLRSNVEHEASDRLSFETNLSLSRSVMNGQAETGGNWINSPFHGGVTLRHTFPIYEDDGTYTQDVPGAIYNVVQLLHEEERVGREFQLVSNLASTYRVTPNLDVRAQLNVDYRMSRDRRYNNPSIPRYGAYGGSVLERTRETENYSGNFVADYGQTFDDVHNFNALAGVEYRHRDYNFHSATGEELPNPLLGQLNLAGVASAVAGRTSEYTTAGGFTRLQYNYDRRYFGSVNLRYDGHSRFGGDQRWGMFYSGALAWDVAREDFMQDVGWLDELRPRVSYGITGNADIGDFASIALFGSGGTYMGNTGLRPQQLGNAMLSWEQAATTDLAVDFAFLGNRLYGNVGVYRTDNEQLLLESWLPSDSGFSDIMENVGIVRNEGIEIEVGGVLVDAGRFMWASDFNITFQQSEVLELEGEQEWMSDPNVAASRIIVGDERHQWWVRNYAGVNPADGRALWYDQNGELTYSVGTADYFAAGSMMPDYYGGWSNEFSYGPVSLDILFQYEYGSTILDEQYSNFHLAPHRGRVLSPDMLNRWTEPGQVTDIPKAYNQGAFPGGTDHNAWSDRRLFDGSYIRLKNVQLNYALPAELANRLGLGAATVFVQSENMVTWTEYPGLDPEVFDRGQTYFPQPRTLEGGIEINF